MSDMMCYTPPSLFSHKFEPLEEDKQNMRLYYTENKVYSMKELTDIGKAINQKNIGLMKSVLINSTLQKRAGILTVLSCLMNKGYVCLTDSIDPIRVNNLLKSQMTATLVTDKTLSGLTKIQHEYTTEPK